MKRGKLFLMAVAAALTLLAGCAEVVQVGTAVGEGAGVISPRDRELINKQAKSIVDASRPMTEKEEYYLGRGVAATILGQYRLQADGRRNEYINSIGRTIALSSDKPYVYGGYHFAVLDTDEVNAMACPGGLILISRGMLQRAGSEEEVAAIVAHEVGHVVNRDGVKAISAARWTQVVTSLGTDAAGRYGGKQLAELTTLFEGSVNDVFKTIVVSGYSQEQEKAADESAMLYMRRAGYDPYGLPDFLARLARQQQGGDRRGFFSTHPGMTERLQMARSFLAAKAWNRTDHAARDQRFNAYRW
jgi:predicted Zn-dependent protease